jgi:hypothetical protein
MESGPSTSTTHSYSHVHIGIDLSRSRSRLNCTTRPCLIGTSHEAEIPITPPNTQFHARGPSGFVQIYARHNHNERQSLYRQSNAQCRTIAAFGRHPFTSRRVRSQSYMRSHPRRRLTLRTMPTTDPKHEQIYAPATLAACLISP